jgi:hypothetical protein
VIPKQAMVFKRRSSAQWVNLVIQVIRKVYVVHHARLNKIVHILIPMTGASLHHVLVVNVA